MASSQGGGLNIQAVDEAPAVKVKKASVTSGKALNLVEEAELSEPEEASDESAEDQVEDTNQSKEESEEVASEDSDELEDAAEDSKEEK